MTVRELLQQSRGAHARYRHAAGHVEKSGAVREQPNDDAARLAVVEAYALREKAEAFDPSHDDPAWGEDTAANKGVPSAKMMDFYKSFFVSVPA